jgi:hypothetical protein
MPEKDPESGPGEGMKARSPFPGGGFKGPSFGHGKTEDPTQGRSKTALEAAFQTFVEKTAHRK